MTFGLNLWMLLGLAAVVIPPLIHLLNRRRYNVVDWGAMQFLQVSETTRRRLLIEELLLMLLRMGLIALLVLALAAPHATSSFFAKIGGRPNRDVVLVFDGSYSMGFSDGKNKSPHEAAKEWAAAFVHDLSPRDSVAILHAKQQVVPILGEPTDDLEAVQDAIAKLPAPRGGCDWPRAVAEAHKLLELRGKHAQREIILLSDGQRLGWADSDSLFHWEMLAARRAAESRSEFAAAERPRVWAVNVSPGRPADPPNYALAPLVSTRALAWGGQRLKFKTAIGVAGQQQYEPPHRIRLEVDGKFVANLPAPPKAPLTKVQVPLTFRHRFETPGSHLVSVILEPDLPEDKRPKGYQVRDTLPGDNRQDVAVEVVDALPVLLVDGDATLTPESSTYFLDKALAQSPDPKKPAVVLTRVVPAKDFDPALLRADLDKARPGSKPRVLVLADVPKLTAAQQKGVAQFLADGGGVLVVLGERMETEAAFWNEQLYRGGTGWLPARLDQVAGDRAKPELAAAPDLRRFHHPSLELFREEPNCTLGKARFPRWWKVSTAGQTLSVPVALLTTADPLLVEKAYKGGRVLLCTVPLDRSWDANLPSVWEFPVLAHELVYYLADTRSAEHNLRPGQPLRYRPRRGVAANEGGDSGPTLLLLFPPSGAPRLFPYGPPRSADGGAVSEKLPAEVVWEPADGPARPLKVERTALQHESLRDTGVYRVVPARHAAGSAGGWRLQTMEEGAAYYVLQPDPRESDLTPASEEERRKVASFVPVQYQNERQPVTQALVATSETQDLWWVFMLGVVLLLCGEVWMTRRLVKNREATV